jgi:hypothetical protein
MLKLEAKFVSGEKFRQSMKFYDEPYSVYECTITNTSKRPIFIDNDVDYTNWTTDNPAIRPALYRAYARPLGFWTTLAPGKTYATTIPIAFGLLKPGKNVTFHLQFHLRNEGRPPSTSAGSTDEPNKHDMIASCPITISVPK